MIIRSSDTDVLILFLAMMHNFRSKDLFLIAGTGSNVRVIHLNKIYNAVSEEVFLCLLGFHAFTGILNNKFIGLLIFNLKNDSHIPDMLICMFLII